MSEKSVRQGGRSLRVVELMPARVEKTLRLMCGMAGVLFVFIAVGLALFDPWLSGHYQIKVIVLGALVGSTLLLAAIGRRVYRSVDRASIRSGTRWLGVTRWASKVPMTKNQVLDIGRNADTGLFVSVRRPDGEALLSVGPFVDGDQAVKAAALLSPGQEGNDDKTSPVDAVEIIGLLEGRVPIVVPRVIMLAVFLILLTPAWFDRDWLDVGLSLLIGVPLLVLAIVWVAPGGGVFYQTDDSETVEFWSRYRLLYRLEYRKSLVTNDPPLFLRKKIHWATFGWFLLIPLYAVIVVCNMLDPPL